MNDKETRASRASMLQKLAMAPIAIGAFAALGAEAEAAATMDQKAAAYIPKPKGAEKCSGCNLYIPGKSATADGTCKLVKGSISPNGWCKFYSPKPK